MSRDKKLLMSIAVLTLAIAIATPSVITFLNANSFEASATESLPQPSYGSNWQTTEVVSTESTSHSYYPSLGVGSDGKVHIAWHDVTDYGDADSDYDVFYKRYEPGVGWTTTEVVSTESTLSSYYPSLGVGSDGTVHIAWFDFTNYGGEGADVDVFYKRYELGVGWTTTEVVSTESKGTSDSPSLGVGSDGTVHIAWDDQTNYGVAGTDWDIFYKRYEPGISWTSTEVVSTESTDSSLHPSLGIEAEGSVHIAWDELTDYGGSGIDRDIFYKRNVFSVIEPGDLGELMDTSRLAHLRELYGSEKSDAYTEIQGVEGYSEIRGLLESKGYVFLNSLVRISAVEGSVLNQSFKGLVYSHWSNVTSEGTAAVLVAALMDDGVDFMLGAYTNILPVEYTSSGPYTIVNAMPYSFIKLCFFDTVNNRTAVWGYSWQESNTNPDWFWNVYSWWRTYTRQHYTWYYYQPWRYIWHYTYWKHWQYN